MAFTTLQRALLEAPFFLPIVPNLPFILDTDVSYVSSGIVLAQVQVSRCDKLGSHKTSTTPLHP